MGYIDSLAITYGNAPSLLVGSLLLFVFITRIVRDPLRHVPGPFICRFTSLWLHYHAWAGTQCSAIQKLHEELGPIVRIGPNDVHISDGEALWPIYMEKGGFIKSDYYSTFDIDGHATIFTTLSLEKRSSRLKSIQPMFSATSCMAAKGIIERCATRMVERMAEGMQTHKPVDILNLARSYGKCLYPCFLYPLAFFVFPPSWNLPLKTSNKPSSHRCRVQLHSSCPLQRPGGARRNVSLPFRGLLCQHEPLLPSFPIENASH